MASGALPPAFPAVRIDGDPYWDGGIYSNTPIEAVLDDKPRRDSVIFAVQHVESGRAGARDAVAGDGPPEGHPVREPRATATSRGRSRSITCVTSFASSRSRLPDEARGRPEVQRARVVGLRHDDARRAPDRAEARRRGPHEGHRLHAEPASVALEGRLRRTRSGCSRPRRGASRSIRSKA